MALTIKIETNFGEIRELYVRLNSISDISKGTTLEPLFRGYLKEQVNEDSFNYSDVTSFPTYVWESTLLDLEFIPDINNNIWEQCYSKFLEVLKENNIEIIKDNI